MYISLLLSSYQRRETTCFAVVLITRQLEDKFLMLSVKESLTNGRGSWVVGVGVGVGVGEELIMIIHMKLIATFALCRIALR